MTTTTAMAVDPGTSAPPAEATAPLLAVRDLTIGFPSRHGAIHTVTKGVGFTLNAGASLALVGESGSGKTMIGRALLGLLPEQAQILGGDVTLGGKAMLHQTHAQWQAMRGTTVGMVFQEPMVSLNPAMRIAEQLTEALIRRRGVSGADARQAALTMLRRVRVRDPERCMTCYPHEFSGGMRQRILLAAVMLLRPKLLIADEPTTALDCVVQKEVLDILLELTREEGTALIFISHNLALVAAYTEQVLVMRRGEVMEHGAVGSVLARPSHDYTLKLLEALPGRIADTKASTDADATAAAAPNATAAAAPLAIDVRGVAIDYDVRRGFFKRQSVRAVHPVHFSVRAGETVAIVGESGSGKTSLAKAVLGLLTPGEGHVLINGEPLARAGAPGSSAQRRSVQMIFQDPYSSLDPRMRVEALILEALRMDRTLSAAQRAERVRQALDDVGLAEVGQRLVHQLSGGQRQRVAIARALASRPAVIIADEPVSALDVTVQRQILEMLVSLQARYGFACLLISHDLGVVEQLAHRVLVMYRGHIVEEGTRDAVFDHPSHPYTRRLLQAVPELRGSGKSGFSVVTRTIPEDLHPSRAYFDPDTTSSPLMPVWVAVQDEAQETAPATSAVPHRIAVVAPADHRHAA